MTQAAPATVAFAPAVPDAVVVPDTAPTVPAVVTPPATDPATPVVAPPITFTEPPVTAPVTPAADTEVVYEPTGDAGLDVALGFVGKRGFAPEHPAMQAALKGDFSVLEAELAKLGDKAQGHERYVALAKDSYTRKQAATKATSDATAKVVYEAVGGVEQWAAVQAWAQANADPAEKKALNAAFALGGMPARAAAKELAALFKRSGSPVPKGVVKAEASTVVAPTNGPIDAKTYGRETEKLYAKLGNKMQASPEYAALRARHLAYRG